MRPSYIALADEYGVELNIGKRWENGISHHPSSRELMRALSELDELINDHHCWKMGGDGDNGETLMYQMDIYFEIKDKQNNATV